MSGNWLEEARYTVSQTWKYTKEGLVPFQSFATFQSQVQSERRGAQNAIKLS